MAIGARAARIRSSDNNRARYTDRLLLAESFLMPLTSARRPLHSFPTRRSSDLSTGSQRSRAESRPVPPSRPTRLVRQGGTDRKSTRLNSGHVKTSYAVFCSTKKNAQPIDAASPKRQG